MSIVFPKEVLESFNIDIIEEPEKESEDSKTYKDSTYTIISKVAYLAGVPKYIFEKPQHPPKLEIYNELEKDQRARIIRNLSILRTALEQNYSAIYKAISYDIKNLNTLPEYIPQESLKQLSADGINLVRANTKPEDYIIAINKIISDRVNNCKDLFPLWIKWNYISELFIMPKGTKKEEIKKAAKIYYENKNSYPYQVYLNWNYLFDGNIFFNDKKFVTLLYEGHEDFFGDPSKITDAGMATKEGIYKFLEESDKVCVMVDCENSDPFKLYATLKNLRQETLLEKIDKIILYDDIHTSSAWGLLGEFTEIPTEHITIDRVKEDKSLVDMKLATGTCKEYYQNGTAAFIIVSSDSDYWGLITSLPEARFLVMVEWEKCGPDIKKALEDRGVTYCYIDDFCTGNSEEVKIAAIVAEIKKRLDAEVHFNINTLLEESYTGTRAEISAQEKNQIYNKYIKKMQLKISSDGNVSVELGQ